MTRKQLRQRVEALVEEAKAAGQLNAASILNCLAESMARGTDNELVSDCARFTQRQRDFSQP